MQSVIPRLSYDEAADLAYFGARLLHSRMIAPLAQRKLPIRIKNIAAAKADWHFGSIRGKDRRRVGA